MLGIIISTNLSSKLINFLRSHWFTTTTPTKKPTSSPPRYYPPPGGYSESESSESGNLDIEKHRNRNLINSRVCGMSCRKQNSCKPGEDVSYLYLTSIFEKNV